jgi:hypothetical protein
MYIISAQASDTPFSSFQNYILGIEYEISSRIKEIEYKFIFSFLHTLHHLNFKKFYVCNL